MYIILSLISFNLIQLSWIILSVRHSTEREWEKTFNFIKLTVARLRDLQMTFTMPAQKDEFS